MTRRGAGAAASCGAAVITTVIAASLCGCGGAPAALPPQSPPPPPIPRAASVGERSVPPGGVVWETAFDDVRIWYHNGTDSGYRATISSEPGGRARVREDGPEAWGKVAAFVPALDLDRSPILETEAAEVRGGDWKIAIVPAPWNDMAYRELTEARTAGGRSTVDLSAKTGWTGRKDVFLVVVVGGEGGSVLLDSMRIRYRT